MILKSFSTPFAIHKTQTELRNDAAKFVIMFNKSFEKEFDQIPKELVDSIIDYFRNGKFELYENRALRMNFMNIVMKREVENETEVIVSNYKYIIVEFNIPEMDIEAIYEVFGASSVKSDSGDYQKLYAAHICHPHVSGTRLCSGGLEDIFRSSMRYGDFVGAYNTLRRFFSGYNPASPYYQPRGGGDREELGPHSDIMIDKNRSGECENWRYRAVTTCQEIKSGLFGLYGPEMAESSQTKFFKEAKINVLSDQAVKTIAVNLCLNTKLSITDFGRIANGSICEVDWGN